MDIISELECIETSEDLSDHIDESFEELERSILNILENDLDEPASLVPDENTCENSISHLLEHPSTELHIKNLPLQNDSSTNYYCDSIADCKSPVYKKPKIVNNTGFFNNFTPVKEMSGMLDQKENVLNQFSLRSRSTPNNPGACTQKPENNFQANTLKNNALGDILNTISGKDLLKSKHFSNYPPLILPKFKTSDNIALEPIVKPTTQTILQNSENINSYPIKIKKNSQFDNLQYPNIPPTTNLNSQILNSHIKTENSVHQNSENSNFIKCKNSDNLVLSSVLLKEKHPKKDVSEDLQNDCLAKCLEETKISITSPKSTQLNTIEDDDEISLFADVLEILSEDEDLDESILFDDDDHDKINTQMNESNTDDSLITIEEWSYSENNLNKVKQSHCDENISRTSKLASVVVVVKNSAPMHSIIETKTESSIKKESDPEIMITREEIIIPDTKVIAGQLGNLTDLSAEQLVGTKKSLELLKRNNSHNIIETKMESTNKKDVSSDPEMITHEKIIISDAIVEQPENLTDSVKQSVGTKKYLEPFKSNDPDENKDIDHPDWDSVKNLTTDEERYKVVSKRWKSKTIPNPNYDLTYHSFRKRRVQNEASSSQNSVKQQAKKRVASQILTQPKPKRARTKTVPCTYLIDDKISNVKQQYTKDTNAVKKEFALQSRSLNAETSRFSIDNYYNYAVQNSRANYGYVNFELPFRDSNMAAIELLQKRNEKMLSAQSVCDSQLNLLRQAREEIVKFCNFYKGLGRSVEDDTDPTVLTENQMKELIEIENVYKQFTHYYKNC